MNENKLHANLADETLRAEFERFINGLTAVRYSLARNVHNEYHQPATYHMWTGYCMAAEKHTIHSYLVEHVSGEAIYAKTIMAATDQKTELGWDDKDITWTWLYKKDE